MKRRAMRGRSVALATAGIVALALGACSHAEPPPRDAHPAPAATAAVATTVWFIALGDDGAHGPRIGCGDSAVPLALDDSLAAGAPHAERARRALEALFALRSQRVGPDSLYNALAAARLGVSRVTQRDDTVRVDLTGTMQMGGECDIPRVQAQIERTAAAGSSVPSIVTLNGQPLEAALSLR